MAQILYNFEWPIEPPSPSSFIRDEWYNGRTWEIFPEDMNYNPTLEGGLDKVIESMKYRLRIRAPHGRRALRFQVSDNGGLIMQAQSSSHHR